ncbi:MAG: nitrogen regulation protein NR(I) [Gammaproteobacteria bacterium]|nr:nitrogen regulation protein NR(I) [Gammaproteobacteria bacterium]
MTEQQNREGNVWVIDDDRSIRWVLEKALQKAEMAVTCFSDGQSILNKLETEQPDVIISDIRMPGLDGLALLKEIGERSPELPVIIMTAHSDMDSAVSAYEGGAFEYLPKPFDIEEAISLTQRAVEQSRSQQGKLSEANPSEANLGASTDIIGESPAMQEVFRAVGRLAHSNMTVLINGESGTGKERVAQALHRHSPRAAHPFIALNMAAVPRELMDSELFGHEKGAFTGAMSSRQGRFMQANGGTLFLDEIGDMPLETQTRLLRVLSEGEFYQVGGHAPIHVDVRIIAATHQNLEQLVEAGDFREDLYHRLNVIRIHVPKLSERQEDIPLLADHFLRLAAKELEVEEKELLPETIQYLTGLAWKGNVRQLENTCRWITVMAPTRKVQIKDLPIELQSEEGVSSEGWEQALEQWIGQHLSQNEAGLLDQVVPTMERILIKAALQHTAGKRQEAARLLGWGRNTLTRKLKELGDDEG